MKDCLFCKIIKGEIPSYKVYEDDNVFAFLDINPVNSGHTLVVPKNHSRNIFDVKETDLFNIMKIVKKLSPIIKDSVGAEGINIISNNEPVAGQIIFHTHIHIIPRFSDDGHKHWEGKEGYKEGERKKIQEKIKNNL